MRRTMDHRPTPRNDKPLTACCRPLAALLLALGAAAPTASGAETAPPPAAADLYPRSTSSLMLDMAATTRVVVAVGERGHILRSTDGQRWEQMPSPVDRMLTSITLVTDQHGWAVGHDAVVLNTTNGGQSWSLQHHDPAAAGPLLDVEFASVTHGYAVGAFGTFLETDDGGRTWRASEADAVTDAAVHLYSLTRADNGRWLLVGEMGFIATRGPDDQEWSVLDSPYDGSLYDVVTFGNAGVLIVGMRGNAFVTDDWRSGQWQPLDTRTVLSLTSINRIADDDYLITTLNKRLLHVRRDQPAGDWVITEVVGDDASTGSFNDTLVRDGRVLVASDTGIIGIAWPDVGATAAVAP